MTSSYTVLIVDASEIDRATYRRCLESDRHHTYQINEAELGETGLAYCENQWPDAILIDFMLPDLDGLEFIRELKQRSPLNGLLPVIMLTGQGDEEVAVQAMKSGAQDYIVKNKLTPDLLCRAVYNTISQVQLRRQLEQQQEQHQQLVIQQANAYNQLRVELEQCKQAEAARHESESMHRVIREALPDLFIRMQRDGTYLDFQPSKEFKGIPLSSVMLGQSIWNILPLELATERMACVERALNTGEMQIHEYQITVNDQTSWQEARIAVCGEDEVLVLVRDITTQKQAVDLLHQLNQELEGRVTARTTALRMANARLHQEITERRIAEKLLKVSQSRFQKLAANIPGVIYQYLLRSDGSSALPYASHGLWDLFEIAPQAVIKDSQPIWERIHPDDVDRLKISILESAQTLQPWHQEFRIVLPTHGIKWIQGTSRPERQPDSSILWDGLLIDVSDRKAAEEALRLSETRLEAILDNTDTVVHLKDLQGRYLLINRAWERLFDKPRTEVLGKTVYDLFPPYVADIMHRNDQRVLATRTSMEFEEQAPQPDGMHTYLSVKFPLLDADGVPYALGGIATDITERKRTELETLTALEHERELSRLKSRFISMASHEFRTPLTVISSSAAILDAYAQRLDEARKQIHFQRIQASVKHMTQLLDDVLTINRADSDSIEFTPVATDLIEFCRTLMDEIQLSSPDYVMQFTSTRAVLAADVDVRLLRQALTNLLSNAIKYSSPHSTVSVTLEQQDDRALLNVQDQGIGIPASDQPRLFESFHRASNVGVIPGTGLGLAIVKKCIDLHHGTISISSQVEQGTLVRVEIPLKQRTL